MSERYKLEVFNNDGTVRKMFPTAIRTLVISAAASWYSRGVKAIVTDLRTGKVIYPLAPTVTNFNYKERIVSYVTE